MSLHFVVRPLAEQDLLEAQEWYEARRPGLGADFRATIDSLFGRIGENPSLYPEVYRGTRRAVVRRFPYLVYFVVSEDTIAVIACIHSKRHRRLARERLPRGL